MSDEKWMQIENYKNYEISSFGNIKNKTRNFILKPSLKSGYLNITILNDDGDRKSCKVHRLVALAFIPNPKNKYSVNHIDHNKLNNNLSNLEWATATEQNKHKRKCKSEIQELVSSRAIWRVDKDTNEKLEYYKTIRIASQWVFDNKLTSITIFNNGNNIKTKICAVARGKFQRNTAFGYRWKYDDINENKYDS